MFLSGHSPSVTYIYPKEMIPEELDLLQPVILPDCQEQRHPFSAEGICASIPSTLRISSAFPLPSSCVPPLEGPRGHAETLVELFLQAQGLCPSFHHLDNVNAGLHKA